MNDIYWGNIEYVLFFLFFLSLIFAAISDLLRYIIPNSISFFVLFLFGVAWLLAPVKASFWLHAGAGFAVLLVGMLLFALRLFGGGDVKLWAACATWFGFEALHTQLAYVSLIGAGIGVFLYLARLVAVRTRNFAGGGVSRASLPRILQPRGPVPYGLAIAAGTILALNRTPFFPHVFG